ncbi:hypothetical protein [Tabrizicola sp.]|uniref:hypothetical protein n=1 Tax=Tabrizicola sp. TaxID=2005166 RepID=UPI0035B1FAEE
MAFVGGHVAFDLDVQPGHVGAACHEIGDLLAGLLALLEIDRDRAPKWTARAMARLCGSPPERPPTSRSPSVIRVMPMSCTAFAATAFAVLRS